MSIILTEEEIAQLLNDAVVIANRAKLSATASVVSFSIPFPDPVKRKLENHFAIDLSPLAAIPMRWVKGDTAPHRDRRGDQRSFERTCLVYLTDSVGEFVVGGERHRIEAGAAHTFREGVDHYTVRTEGERLLIGPMSESGLGVGAPSLVVFFFTNDDFLTNESLTPTGFVYVTPIGYGSITIFNLPPPPPTTDNPNASIFDYSEYTADWTPPAGKTFGGWKFWSGTDPQFEPLDSTPSKVYKPGEVYEYTSNSVLIPNWVDAPRAVLSFPPRGFHPFQDPMRRALNRQDVHSSFIEKAKVKDSSQLTQLRAMGPRQSTVQTNTSAQQATKSALARVRNGGCTAPKKKTALKN